MLFRFIIKCLLYGAIFSVLYVLIYFLIGVIAAPQLQCTAFCFLESGYIVFLGSSLLAFIITSYIFYRREFRSKQKAKRTPHPVE